MIRFECVETLPLAPEAIAAQILEVARWPDFHGYGPIPGIRSARFLIREPEVVGSRIQVENQDGSRHTEEIVIWNVREKLALKLRDFSKPLSLLAQEFTETWHFRSKGNATEVRRVFEIEPRSFLTRLPLRILAVFLKRAIARHLRSMRERG